MSRHARHQERTPPVVVAVNRESVEQAAAAIHRRLRTIFATRKCDAYLFVDSEGNARLVHEKQASLPLWCREYWPDFVGRYSTRAYMDPGGKRHALTPDVEGLVEDIRAHLGWVESACVRVTMTPPPSQIVGQ